MTTYKRVNGDYEIVALNSGTITLDAQTTIVSTGDLTVPLGNVAAGNLDAINQVSGVDASFTDTVSAANVVASGNVTGAYIIGDGSLLTNVTAVANVAVTQIANTTTVFSIQSSGGPILAEVGGVANIMVLASTGTTLSGTTTTGNLVTNIISSDDSSFVQVADGLRVLSDIETEGELIATGNISGNYVLGNGALLTGVITSVANINNGTSNVGISVADGNVTAGVGGVANVLVITSTGANITGTLNATGNANVGNIGATNAVLAGALSGVTTISASGNANVGNLGATGIFVTTVSATGNANVGNLGATNIVGTLSTAAQPNITSLGTLSALNIVGNTTQTGNINITGNINATGNLNYDNVVDLVVGDPLIYIGANNTGNLYDLGFVVAYDDGLYQHGGFVRDASDGIWKVFGNVVAEPTTVVDFANAIYQPFQAGSITTTGIINANANGVGNIGNSTGYFNTVFAKATSAQYADVAELYLADQDYAPGTVLSFGGSSEVTICNQSNDHRVAGVVSTNPAHLMNSALTGLYPVKLALVGRVPCQVHGPVQAGDILVSAENGWAQVNNQAQAGRIIGKSLENSATDAVIEIVVGKH